MRVLLLLALLVYHVSAKIFNLAELEWTLKNQNGSVVVPATVPSQVHLDLTRAGVITEPLLEINDFTERWIVYDNWTYTADLKSFLNAETKEAAKVLLVFYGLDTIANITLNGHPVAWTNNQFRQYVFDVSDLVLPDHVGGNSNLTVYFESAYKYGQNVSSRPDAEIVPGGNGDFEFPGVRHWIRKVQSDFGWDWGPAFVPSGIYKPAYLISLSNTTSGSFELGTPPVSPAESTTTPDPIFIEESSLDIYKVGESFSVPPDEHADWVVNISLAIHSASRFDTPVLTLAIDELNLKSPEFDLPVLGGSQEPTWVNATWTIPDSIPQRWYPHDLATGPKLYNFTVTLQLSSSTAVKFNVRSGFRTVQLWHFNINGKEFYSKGTNIIPFDPFYARVSPEKVKWILESAALSGQNMLRIWGGGTYQPSSRGVAGGVYDFYDICDELGILAWSEFIFSDALYPINDFMLDTIDPEVRQNVRRVNRHPSNVQWAGGNEIEGIVTSVNQSLPNGTVYLDEDFLHDIAVSETRSVAYTDCSTTKGVLSLDPYVLRFNNGTPGDIYGNSERYNYDPSQAFNYDTFPVSRFVNEFGYHSMPSFYSWEEVLTSPDDFSFNSTVVMSRDHHPPAGGLAFPNPNAPEGQGEMTRAVQLWLPTPNTTDTNQTFAQWCWSTQIFQSMTMLSEIAWYRRGAGKPENNLGALVWQLNDIWQGVSWSSVEYSGRWKVLNYGMAGAFEEVNVNAFWTAENETLEVVVTSDRWEEVGGSVQLTWYDWHGKELVSSTHKFVVPALNNSVVFSASGLDLILPVGKTASEVWLLLNSTASVDGRTVTSEQYFTPTSLSNATLIDPEINVTRGSGDLTFTLNARGGVAPWTWIDHPSGTVGVFVDQAGKPSNGFYLVPEVPRLVKFILNAELSTRVPSAEEFIVRSLWNNTHNV
ncbi:glycoside hydrolase family 2 protein [Cyathus striatus]|nr:glycoside hydrolase family 2 protein [Cyathus striatus]